MGTTDDVAAARRALGERLAELRIAAGLSQPRLAPLLGYSRSAVANAETGRGTAARDFWQRCDQVLATDGVLTRQYDELDAQLRQRQRVAAQSAQVARPLHLLGADDQATYGQPLYWDAEALRRDLADAVNHAAMADADLDDWEHAVQQYGLATRYRPAAALLQDLTADFAELCRLLERRRAILVPNRLTRVMAQMAGLMSLTLIKLDQRVAARNWARTAKLVASEAGDIELHAWVRAQEAYAQYYSGNLVEAVYVAAHAQHIAHQTPCSGVALAAALEGRAQAVLGRNTEATTALNRAEQALDGMEPTALLPSAFGYNRAQFSFHAGNAFTHLGDTQAARAAHERALELYPTDDYLDRALVMLDRAECLIRDDEVSEAADWTTRALGEATTTEPDPMILNRARQVLSGVPAGVAALPAVDELRTLLDAKTSR